ncbi:hypothetical protein SAMN05216178_6974 [Pseudomonas saponiphila]|jgi:DNA-binding SARP family transcriptional activator|uniref:Uncharacterized protein n=1 Tax=Pseudomonas saponiphila TaxID=556534 RepID=A0A1H5A476_9PSED|nr:hypothetical protein [Pseudomonas saponiphila]SED37057.1 hypothetical protein SAMN05216178_6974 [Pseudomonas saponiphila]
MSIEQSEAQTLDMKLRAAGMLTVAEMLNGGPLDAFIKHAGVTDISSLLKWAEMRRAELLRQIALYEIGERDKGDDLYEWVLAHCSAFTELHINLKAGLASASNLAADVSSALDHLNRVESNLRDLISRHEVIVQSTNRLIDKLTTARDSMARLANHAGVSEYSAVQVEIKDIDEALAQARQSLASLDSVPTESAA